MGLNPSRQVIAAVAHRGPDGEGWKEIDTPFHQLYLGHRRLAIIDPRDKGLQPMAYMDGRYWLTYNGEIFNYIELRNELIARNYKFKTDTDSEVLLASYAEWGPDCVKRFNGMFAFVIVDTVECKLFVARDRFGIKPLYFWRDGSSLAFASEVKQILCLGLYSARLDTRRAYEFLAYGMLGQDAGTLFQSIYSVAAGTSLVLDYVHWTSSSVLNFETWYRYPEATTQTLLGETRDAVAEVFELLESSVELRLRSDVQVGSCLSGGLDSSMVVSLMAKKMSEPPTTVSACFDGPIPDERKYIDQVTQTVGSRSIKVFPGEEDLAKTLERCIYHQDSPLSTTSVLAQWSVFQRARAAGVVVMLDGQGADEIACGYHAFFPVYQKELLSRGSFIKVIEEIRSTARRHGVGTARQILAIVNQILPKHLGHLSYYARGIHRPSWLSNSFSSQFEVPVRSFRDVDDLIRYSIGVAGLPMLLQYEDRNSMAHGIEARLPFLDHRFVDLMMTLSSDYKIVRGETKWILRRSSQSILPAAIYNRQDKMAFTTPEDDWLRGPLRQTVSDGVEFANQTFPRLFNRSVLKKRVMVELQSDRRISPWVWRVATFGHWARIFGVAHH